MLDNDIGDITPTSSSSLSFHHLQTSLKLCSPHLSAALGESTLVSRSRSCALCSSACWLPVT